MNLHNLAEPTIFRSTTLDRESIDLPPVKRFLALDRPGLYWNEPKWGYGDYSDIKDGQFLLLELEAGGYLLLIPLAMEVARFALAGDGERLHLARFDGVPREVIPEAPSLWAGVGVEPYALITQAATEIRATFRTFNLTTKKRQQLQNLPWAGLGWCTWDAFYGAVSAEKILDGVREFQKIGCTPSWVLIDAGWMTADGDYLCDFAPDEKKFPGGFAPLVEELKALGVKHVGAWQALTGYWGGIKPDSPLGRRFTLHHNRGDIRPWKPEAMDLYLLDPKEAFAFHNEWHEMLCKAGISFVKVDGQSSLEVFSEGLFPRVDTMKQYQHAIQASSLLHLEGNLLHCMSNGNDVGFHMLATALYRNSDDFFPDRPASHATHLINNAFNQIWTRQFAIPDWDMFWSNHPAGELHAAARVASNSLTYVSDRPGEHDPRLLRELSRAHESHLGFTLPDVPVERLFEDPRNTGILELTIPDLGPDQRLHVYFNVREDGQPQQVQQEIALGGSEDELFVTVRSADKTEVIAAGTTIEFDIPGGSYDSVCVQSRGVEALGLVRTSELIPGL